MTESKKPQPYQLQSRTTAYIHSEAFPEIREIYFPYVYLILHHNEREIICMSAIDSGAHSCLFPYSMGEQLGLDVEKGKRADFHDNEIAYFWDIEVTLESSFHFPLYAGFSKKGDDRKAGLLGHVGFFDKFDVGFEMSKGSIILTPTSPDVKVLV